MKKQVAYLQKIFYDLWNDFGSVYLVVKHSDRTVIGKRGFTDDEKQHGIVLVFNSRTNNKMEWDAEGNVSCVLAFGASREEVHLHHDDLVAVFSPEAAVQFLRNDVAREQPAEGPAGSGEGGGKQVVSLSRFKEKKETGRS